MGDNQKLGTASNGREALLKMYEHLKHLEHIGTFENIATNC